MSDNRKYIQAQKFKLAGSGISATDTSIVLQSFMTPNAETIAMTDIGTLGCGTLGPGTSREEVITFTGVTQNGDGTATLTGVTRGCDFRYPYTQDTNLRKSHSGNEVFILTNNPQFYDSFANKENDETINREWLFDLFLPRSNAGNATDANQLITYAQALAMATGTTSINRIVVSGNAGETVVAGQLLYLLVSDGEWYKCDADTAATVDNIILGIAQGAGTNGNPITSGILLFGLDSNQTGLTDNTAYYAGNTAGAISSTPGTVEVSVGVSRSTTSILFYPRYNQQLTEDQQDALLGDNTDIPVGAGNKYVTQTGLQKSAEIFAVDASASSTAYTATLSPAPTSLSDGMVVRVKIGVANTTTTPTLNVNGLGAKTIVKLGGTALAASDISAGMYCTFIYDLTNTRWVMQNPIANTVTDVTESIPYFMGAGGSTIYKNYWNYSIPFISGTAALWTASNVLTSTSLVNQFQIIGLTSSANDVIYKALIYSANSLATQLSFGTQALVVEFISSCTSVGTDDMNWGVGVSGSFQTVYNSAANDRACFTVDRATSKLYAHTSGGGGGSDHTEVEITGITLTNANTYRIEYNPGVNTKFYVNGVLKATITTTLPNSGLVEIGFGGKYHGTGSMTDYPNKFSVPYVAVAKS